MAPPPPTPPPPPPRPSQWKLLTDRTMLTPEVLEHNYPGTGTEEDPFAVDWIPNDPRNPHLLADWHKWVITVTVSFANLAVSFASTTFSGALPQLEAYFGTSTIVATLTVSLFVLGFAIGPMVWGPLSELYGRQTLWLLTFGLMTLFGGASIGSSDIASLVVLRFLAGATGASAIANSAGVVSDIFTPAQRGLAVTIYCAAPFLGPTLGPIAGGFLAEAAGWRWVDAMTVLFGAAIWVLGSLIIPETYAPRLLILRARALSKRTGRVYRSKLEIEKGPKKPGAVFRVAMTRPWVFLVMEPIVLTVATYIAIVYGTLYLIFSAFPIVFTTQRHWSQGVSGLSFVGNMVGQILALLFYSLFYEPRYRRALKKNGGALPPEKRLLPALLGAPLLPIGLIWFAWTTFEYIPWIVPLLGSTLFGFGQVLLFLSLANYLIDSYAIYAASVMAANAVLRALFAAAFPLFTSRMYETLGVQWASTVPALLSLLCLPFPYLFYKFGHTIRSKCKYSAEAMRAAEALQAALRTPPESEEKPYSEAPSREEGLKEEKNWDESHATSAAASDRRKSDGSAVLEKDQ